MKTKNIIIIIVLVLVARFIISCLATLGIIFLLFFHPSTDLNGLQNYDKDYFIREYGGDLDSNLSIFPNDKSILDDASFLSSFSTSLFDTDGYMILKSRYNKYDFENEINRLKDISVQIYENCYRNSKSATNVIKYDDTSYEYPAYVTIDGFDSKYEYALINYNELEIIYVYLSYPNINNLNYNDYLKKDKSEYSKYDTLSLYSMYMHSFDNGVSFSEFGDC